MTGRVVGVDVARAVALVGMMATHILPGLEDGRVSLSHHLAAGRASALFAVLAGVSLVLVAGRRTPLRGPAWWGMLAGTLVRAALLALVGLLIGGVDSGIAVILVYYAVLFVAAVPFMALRTGPLLATAAAWALLAPVASMWLRRRIAAPTYDVPSLDSLAVPGALARELLVTGYYPVLTWLPFVLVGVVIGRMDLRSTATAGKLATVGAGAVAVAWLVSDALVARPGVRGELIRTFEGAGWRGDLDTTLAHGLYGVTPPDSAWWLAVRAPHSGTTFDLLMTIGSACLVLAGCLLLGRAAPRVCSVLFGAGAMTLTLYSLHIVLRNEGWWDGDDMGTYLGQVALVLAIGALFRWGGHRGPMELFLGELSSAARDAVSGRR
jgi:Heparan-alpha-glucosaminide N-acetyltransferase, catalytic